MAIQCVQPNRNIYFFVDCETTGLDRKRNTILEICIIKHVDRVEVDRLHLFIHPTQKDIAAAAPIALEMNCYSHDIWISKGAVDPTAAARRINSFFEPTSRAAFVAHNANYDWSMINNFLRRNNLKPNLPYKRIDTCSIAFAALQPLGLPSEKLDSIRDFLGWSHENSHTALQDCEDLIKLFYLCSVDPKDKEQVTMLQKKLKGA